MSEPFQVNLSRATPTQPWGFRLQGGSDFSTPLSVQSVNPNSIAEHCGLKAGDAVLQIGNRSSHELQHEQAKQEIGASGNNVIMLVQRGVVKVWQPKVTPLADIKPGQMQSVPTQPGGDPEPYVQRTSLAADKSEPMKVNFFNKSARPFPGAGGSAAPSQPAPSVPVIMNAQYNTPMGMYSTQNALEAFDCQSQAMVDDMDSLNVEDKDEKESNNNITSQPTPSVQPGATTEATSTSVHLQVSDKDLNTKRSASPTYLAVHQDEEKPRVRTQSPSFLSVHSKYSQDQPPMRSVSPTLLAIQAEEEGQKSAKQGSAVFAETKEGEEIRYRGYTNPNKQSKSFKLLQQELDPNAPQGAPVGGQNNTPSGMRSVKAPTGPPPNVQIQQAQHMTCKGCGSLIVGVFVRIKGEPMHPECFKCVRCGKNLKNQGHFTVEGQMHCEQCAQIVSAPPDQNMVATAVYR